MKLHEAMMLATTEVKHEPGDWNVCALGGAGTVMGIPQGENAELFPARSGYSTHLHVGWGIMICTMPDGRSRADHIHDKFPWLRDKHNGATWSTRIAYKFDECVCRNLMTYEQLVDYVRRVEPDCGECNRFDCTCPKVEAVNADEVKEWKC